MRLVVQEFLTLDGVSQGPGSPEEDTSDGFTRGGWFAPYVDEVFLELVGSWLGEADGLLLGRRTYQNFARDWPKMTDHPFGGIMNTLPKYVASHGPTPGEWSPTTVLSGRPPLAGEGTEATARSGTAGSWQRAAGPVTPCGRTRGRATARDRAGGAGPGPTALPGRWRAGRPATRQPSNDSRRPVGAHLRLHRGTRVRDLRTSGIATPSSGARLRRDRGSRCVCPFPAVTSADSSISGFVDW